MLLQRKHKKRNSNWSEIPHHSYRILIVRGFGIRKTNSLFNSRSHQPDIDKIYPFKAKYPLLINKRESAGMKHLNDSKAFILYSNDMDDIYKNSEEYNTDKRRKLIIVFDVLEN